MITFYHCKWLKDGSAATSFNNKNSIIKSKTSSTSLPQPQEQLIRLERKIAIAIEGFLPLIYKETKKSCQ
jgi:hypothetical protein